MSRDGRLMWLKALGVGMGADLCCPEAVLMSTTFSSSLQIGAAIIAELHPLRR
jgi:hypothetical protein